MSKTKISKLMLWPNRKVNLGNYNTLDLNAGVEVIFDKPVAFDSKEVKQAFEDARKTIKDEFNIQIKPYRKIILDKRKGGDNNG